MTNHLHLSNWIKLGKQLLYSWIAAACLAVLPSLAIYSDNVDVLALDRLFLPIVYGIALVIISGLVWWGIYRNIYKAGLMTSWWILLYYSYGYLYLKLAEQSLVRWLPVSLNIVLLSSYVLALVLVGWLIWRLKSGLNKLLKLVSVTSLVLLGLNLLIIVPFEINSYLASRTLKSYVNENLQVSLPTVSENLVRPDIYYIVFDRYPRQDVLAEYFDYDNQPHLQSLTDKGFYISSQSSANYPYTFLSLSSSLNMSYLDFVPELLGENYKDRIPIFENLIQTNLVARSLQQLGYRYVIAGNFWDPTRIADADQNYNLYQDFDEFQLSIHERTLFNTLKGVAGDKQLYTGVDRVNIMLKNLDYRRHHLLRETEVYGPKFVLGHFLIPHGPNVFSQDCRPLTFEEIRSQEVNQAFLSEVQCANKFMDELATSILANHDRPVVIIFQSDEGPFLPAKYFNGDNLLSTLPDDHDSYHIHASILNSIYMSDKEDFTQPVNYQELGWQPNSSPVNTFRTIFNYYFQTDLELFPNRTFIYTNVEKPYDWKEITDLLEYNEPND